MFTKVVEAVKGVVKKWRDIRYEGGKDWVGRNCPLCKVFPDCIGCPIRNKTGFKNCLDTPYMDWLNHQLSKHRKHAPYRVECPECEKLSQAELDFLTNLYEEIKGEGAEKRG